MPYATAADAVVLTERYCPHIGILVELYGLGLGIMVLLAAYLQIDYVARYHMWYKHH